MPDSCSSLCALCLVKVLVCVEDACALLWNQYVFMIVSVDVVYRVYGKNVNLLFVLFCHLLYFIKI